MVNAKDFTMQVAEATQVVVAEMQLEDMHLQIRTQAMECRVRTMVMGLRLLMPVLEAKAMEVGMPPAACNGTNQALSKQRDTAGCGACCVTVYCHCTFAKCLRTYYCMCSSIT